MTFGWRAIAIWRKDLRIVALVVFVVVSQFVTSMTLLSYSDTVRLQNNTCMAVPGEGRFNPFPWFYLTAMLCDFILMFISTYKLWEFASLDQPVGKLHSSSNHSYVRSDPSGLESGTRSQLQVRSRSRSQSSSYGVNENVSSFRLKCQSLTPLLGQLLKNGLFYFLGAGEWM